MGILIDRVLCRSGASPFICCDSVGSKVRNIAFLQDQCVICSLWNGTHIGALQ